MENTHKSKRILNSPDNKKKINIEKKETQNNCH